MWPASPRFFATLARSHTSMLRVDVLRDGQLARRIEPTVTPATDTLAAIGGSVRVDRQTIRRDGSVTFLDLSGALLPNEVSDLFAPLIGELRVWSGVRYWDATDADLLKGTDREYVPVATLVITDAQGDYPTLSVSGFDRMWFLSDFAANYSVPAGTATAAALRNLLTSQIPAAHLQMSIPDTEHVTGALLYEAGTSSADAAHAMALSMGMVLYADPMGTITVTAEPTTDDPPVMVYEPGSFGMLLRPKPGVSAADARNAVVFTGEPPDGTPVTGYAEDSDPASLTYAPRAGVRPVFQSSPLVRTSAQAALAAKTALARILGLSDAILTPVVPNPCLESGDVIQVRDPAQGINIPVIADSFTVPLRAADGAQEITCRQRVLR